MKPVHSLDWATGSVSGVSCLGSDGYMVEESVSSSQLGVVGFNSMVCRGNARFLFVLQDDT